MNTIEIAITTYGVTDEQMSDILSAVQAAGHTAAIDEAKPRSILAELGQDITAIVEVINGLGYTTDEDAFEEDDDILDY